MAKRQRPAGGRVSSELLLGFTAKSDTTSVPLAWLSKLNPARIDGLLQAQQRRHAGI